VFVIVLQINVFDNTNWNVNKMLNSSLLSKGKEIKCKIQDASRLSMARTKPIYGKE
jgi:hypothetical protein